MSTWSRPALNQIRVDTFANHKGRYGIIIRSEPGDLIIAVSGTLVDLWTNAYNQTSAAIMGITLAEQHIVALAGAGPNEQILDALVYNESAIASSLINEPIPVPGFVPRHWDGDIMAGVRDLLVQNGQQRYFGYKSDGACNEAARWLAHSNLDLNITEDNDIPPELLHIIDNDKNTGLFWPLR